ncbi:hypothetical protein PG999_001951 [Apiospora kogelbergensis]|uniref:Cytochrome P450 n=1 Tax=Apiospora kogelbergensis TaxID=1337665 RepID=A0AAW0R6Z2_9PEZI
MSAYIVISFLVAFSCLYKLLRLLSYIRTAKSTGLPYTLTFIHEFESWAYLTDPVLRWALRSRIMRGRGWPAWARFMVKDWHYEDKRAAHDQFGAVFLVVSPGGMAFIKPPEKMKMLEPFGPNVVSLDGARWRFHLGITLPPFTADNVLGLIWDETLRQVDIMAASWSHSGAKASLKHNVYSLTMNTMSLVGFGKRSEGAEVSGAVPRGHTLSLVESIQSVVLHLPHIMLLPHWALKQVASKAHQGYSELEMYMTELIKQEKTRLDSGVAENKSNRATLLTAVLDANTQKVGRDMLTDTEIKGNIFMFLLAGYDTTANTILFCTITLALYPSIQAQVINEVDLVWKKAEMAGRTELSLAHDMSRFRYLIAFMYEVMRVFPIVLPIARLTAGPQSLHIGTNNHRLPTETHVVVNNTAIHHDPANWLSPSIIEPRRWLVSDPHSFDPTKLRSPQEMKEINEGTMPIPSHRRENEDDYGQSTLAHRKKGAPNRGRTTAQITTAQMNHRLWATGT